MAGRWTMARRAVLGGFAAAAAQGERAQGGWVRRLSPDGRQALDPAIDLYDQAFVLFALAVELYGSTGAGLLSGTLWLASPFVLGIGHLDGVDIPFALATALTCWSLVRWLRRRTRRGLCWLGLAFAAAAGSQISGLLVVASVPVLLVPVLVVAFTVAPASWSPWM